ncbi:LLM class flavin-dependent oxidoreductase [Amycolatopsis pithecellobii]|uniref:LLM class flavin-dependent oxidoreductase n=1 Tax=Amycolatopsis pithecellobii TaxID=664692 RepID=A0A6N7Z9J6_9PSEU|nr:LLM class flavin-dependent oxidoreductase [Amycolatopsis pithecellobii]MTD58404.1 LLM class flavin-dependent oxidoreductase [Amycolatopsis pithecellobii]
MRIGVGLPNQIRDVNAADLPQWAVLAEELGFASLGTVGRNAYPGVADTVALAAAAAVTSRIGLMSTVLIAPAWPPALLAKELAGIDGISGGRLTLGAGVGIRPDDFLAEGYGLSGRGARFDRDLETFRAVWGGEPVGGGPNAAVPGGTRQIPLLLGGQAPAAFKRMARWGEGYIGGSVPPEVVAPSFDEARAAWREAGREGSPRLAAVGYFSLGDGEKGRAAVRDYYEVLGDELADFVSQGVSTTAEEVKTVVKKFADLGTDELILYPTVDDVDEVKRLADLVL